MSNERPSRFGAHITKHSLCARIPADDDTFCVGGDNRIGLRGYNGLSESSIKVHYVLRQDYVAVTSSDSSAHELKCRGFMQRDVVCFIAFYFVLRIIRSRVVSVSLVLCVF